MYEYLITLQKRLSKNIAICPYKNIVNLIGGIDVSFEKGSNKGFCAIVVMDKDFNITETVFHIKQTNIPYISGLLSFRELPIIYQTIKRLKKIPEIFICDSQGIAHPRMFGLASHLGYVLNIPTIGCAKNRLVGTYTEPGNEKGEYSILRYKEKDVGAVLRTKKNCNPVFISPGNLIDIPSSIKTILNFTTKYKIPEPVRLAHIYSNKFRRENLL
jgi:deoxyribonuclease V